MIGNDSEHIATVREEGNMLITRPPKHWCKVPINPQYGELYQCNCGKMYLAQRTVLSFFSIGWVRISERHAQRKLRSYAAERRSSVE